MLKKLVIDKTSRLVNDHNDYIVSESPIFRSNTIYETTIDCVLSQQDRYIEITEANGKMSDEQQGNSISFTNAMNDVDSEE